jgi:HNH endonuclease
MRNEKGQFLPGMPPENRMPIGSIRIRTRHKRYGEQRAWIKVAEPNTWQLLARYQWEKHHGAIPKGLGIHHKDENTLHDAIDNLELVSKKDHLALHRPAFQHKVIQSLIEARRRLRWSTKSQTKQVGHPRTWTTQQLQDAWVAYRNGEGTKNAIEQRFGLPLRTLSRHRPT